MSKKALILVLLYFSPQPALAKVSCARNPIFCRIVSLQPDIDNRFAFDLSNYIYIYSKKFKTNPYISVAIAMQESSIQNIDRKDFITTDYGYVVYDIADIGVFQINIKTIRNLKKIGWYINIPRFIKDIRYQTYWHIRLLKRKMDICANNRYKLMVAPGNEWSCYHSFNYANRIDYYVHVHQFLPDSLR